MKNLKLQVITMFVVGVTLSWFLLQTQVAYAFVVNKQWATNSTTYGYGGNYPTGAWRDRAVSAANAWTNVSTSSWTWTLNGVSPQGRLYYQAIDGAGGTLGSTNTNPRCGAYVCTFTLTVDWDESWYTGTGTPSSIQKDLQSMLTHELGHAAALGHTEVTCTGSTRPTMCPTLPTGTNYMRSLEADDRNGIANAYP